MPQQANNGQIKQMIETRPLKFRIRTGSGRWECTLQDRATYEKSKLTRTDSADSASSMESNSSSQSAQSPTQK